MDKLTENIKQLKNYVPDFYNEDIADILLTSHSTRIEGNLMTFSQVEKFITSGVPTNKQSMHFHNMVQDHQNAIALMKSYSGDILTEQKIKAIGGAVMKNTGGPTNHVLGTYDTTKGDYRFGLAHGGTQKTYIDHTKVEPEMKKLISFLNKELKRDLSINETSDVAFYAHYQFVQIHPFGDGNGRTSRILMNHCLLEKGLPMGYVMEKDKIKYFNALNSARNKADVNIFNSFMFQQYKSSIVERIEKYKSLQKIASKKKSKTIKSKNSGMSFSVLG
ncbi:MAG: Fic family protein [Cytophagales bacterium]|nr:Fic family protein [Cytophagales bacterium]